LFVVEEQNDFYYITLQTNIFGWMGEVYRNHVGRQSVHISRKCNSF